jgi:hypothetical protein
MERERGRGRSVFPYVAFFVSRRDRVTFRSCGSFSSKALNCFVRSCWVLRSRRRSRSAPSGSDISCIPSYHVFRY